MSRLPWKDDLIDNQVVKEETEYKLSLVTRETEYEEYEEYEETEYEEYEETEYEEYEEHEETEDDPGSPATEDVSNPADRGDPANPANMGILKDKTQLEPYITVLERWPTFASFQATANNTQADLALA